MRGRWDLVQGLLVLQGLRLSRRATRRRPTPARPPRGGRTPPRRLNLGSPWFVGLEAGRPRGQGAEGLQFSPRSTAARGAAHPFSLLNPHRVAGVSSNALCAILLPLRPRASEVQASVTPQPRPPRRPRSSCEHGTHSPVLWSPSPSSYPSLKIGWVNCSQSWFVWPECILRPLQLEGGPRVSQFIQ